MRYSSIRKPRISVRFDLFQASVLLVMFGIVAYLIITIVMQAVGIKAGYIYEKDYSPARCDTTYIDKKPYITCYPESYTLYIEDIVNDERKTNWHETTPAVYERAKIGDWYNSVCDCLSEARP